MTMEADASAGALLRQWRHKRKLSQLDLAGSAEISARHLSFVETGRASGSRDMLLRLAEHLGLPMRARNQLLVSAGYAPLFSERALDMPDMRAAKAAVDAVLQGHTPFPALAIDRHWILIAANDALSPLLAGVDPQLLAPPVNVLRLSLHPRGLAPRIDNLAEWRRHLLQRLWAQIDQTADAVLIALFDELSACSSRAGKAHPARPDGVAVPLVLRRPQDGMPLSFISTTTVFGTPVDITLAELALECFYPADDATRCALMG